ncbi:MAG TPA: cupin domain-containing protein [Burkholderiales bacterium]|jgi:mannose-6-phosphate isomerase-like protein (cupin superfamily)|nr:cupin domain-containing protein [Burkholderiales bacterium]
MEIESTLRVISESHVKKLPGVVQGQTVQPLVGVPEFPSERVRVAVATFQPDVHEELHWHAIEVFYYVMAGSATVRDYHGKEYAVSAGSAIYAPPGIAGSHEWKVGKDGLQLLSIRATLEGHKRMQFTVDRETRRSYIELDELAKMDGVSFRSHY